MIVNKQLANSAGVLNKDCWETDINLFKSLDYIFKFTLDPCCYKDTAKCNKFYTPLDNGLIQDWSNDIVFMNPPYSRGNIDRWVKKAYEESLKGSLVVALIPVSSSAKWWHKYIVNKANIIYIQGRVKFVGADSTAPFSSAIVIFGDNKNDIHNIEKLRGGLYQVNKKL